MKLVIALVIAVAACTAVTGQRITTIQLDGVQYFISRMNPYSPELNYFLAYQYCRSLGLQLVSFETKEKSDSMMQYLRNAGYTKYDFWTSGNNLGTDMFLWMSTGLPFNATFDYMIKQTGQEGQDQQQQQPKPRGTEPQRVARESAPSGSVEGCVAMTAPSFAWNSLDCMLIKDFICEQTRCYYYNYGSIPVSATQGNRRPYPSSPSTTPTPTTTTTTTVTPTATPKTTSTVFLPPLQTTTTTSTTTTPQPPSPATVTATSTSTHEVNDDAEFKSNDAIGEHEAQQQDHIDEQEQLFLDLMQQEQQQQQRSNQHQNPEQQFASNEASDSEDKENLPQSDDLENNLRRRHQFTPGAAGHHHHSLSPFSRADDAAVSDEHFGPVLERLKVAERPGPLPAITSLFTDKPINIRVSSGKAVDDDIFAGLQTHEVGAQVRQQSVLTTSGTSNTNVKVAASEAEPESSDDPEAAEQGPLAPEWPAHTIGPYDSVGGDMEYQSDQPSKDAVGGQNNEEDSTIVPETEAMYRYNIKVRSNGKVLESAAKK